MLVSLLKKSDDVKPFAVRVGWSAVILFLCVAIFAVNMKADAATTTTGCGACVEFRLDHPIVVRGPFKDELDTTFNEFKVSSGLFRGFSSNSQVYSIDGSSLEDMGGTRKTVLPNNTCANSTAPNNTCKNYWLNSVFSNAHDPVTQGAATLGFIHQETYFVHPTQTYKQMDISWSYDQGTSWAIPQTIIQGMDKYPPYPKEVVGEGDCTAVLNGSYYYLYCGRTRPANTPGKWIWGETIVARAPASDVAPGNWFKLYTDPTTNIQAWSQPSLGGNADSLGKIGTTSAYFSSLGEVGLFGAGKNGLTLNLSSDFIHFKPLSEPILSYDANNWTRPQSTDLYAYANVHNYEDGGNKITGSPDGSGEFYLTYTYLPDNADFSQRYLVFQGVHFQKVNPIQTSYAEVGVELSRWQEDGSPILRTTDAPAIGYSPTGIDTQIGFNYVKSLGYLLTSATEQGSAGESTNEVEECWSNSTGYDDYIVGNVGDCEKANYTKVRTLGWLYKEQQSNNTTQPLYVCLSSSGKFHFVSNQSDCENLGTMQSQLGYILSDSTTTPAPPAPTDLNVQYSADGNSLLATWKRGGTATAGYVAAILPQDTALPSLSPPPSGVTDVSNATQIVFSNLAPGTYSIAVWSYNNQKPRGYSTPQIFSNIALHVSLPVDRNLADAWKSASSVVASNVTAPDGTLTAQSLIEDTTSDQHALLLKLQLQPGATYTFSVAVNNPTGVSRSLSLVDQSSDGSNLSEVNCNPERGSYVWPMVSPMASLGNGWYMCSMVFTLSQVENSQGETSLVENNLWIKLNDGSAWSYTGNGTSGLSLWIPKGATPLTVDPNFADTSAWTTWHGSVASSNVNLPDGTWNAQSLIEDTTNNQHALSFHVSNLTPGTPYVFSVAVNSKDVASVRNLQLLDEDFDPKKVGANNASNLCNPTTGETVWPTSSPMPIMASGWYLCSLSFTPTQTDNTLWIKLYNGNSGWSYTGDGKSGLSIWRPQIFSIH